jgi:hypothetical protein
MISEIKGYVAAEENTLDISSWMSNALLDITAMLTVGRDHGGIKSRDRLHPALAMLNTTMTFLWGFLQFQRLPRPIARSFVKLAGFLLGHFRFFEKNSLSSHLVRNRLEHGSSRPDYGKSPRTSYPTS